MNIPTNIANGIYIGFPILWCGLLALTRTNYLDEFFGAWLGLMLWPALICGVAYWLNRRRGNLFNWQRWFFWLGLTIPAILRSSQNRP